MVTAGRTVAAVLATEGRNRDGPGGPNATWGGAERKQKKIEMGRKGDWAEMVLGCAEKKKKVFRF
jgi:hypothetical protein